MRRQRGITVLEVSIALAVVTVLVGAAIGGVRAHQRSVAREWSRLEASRAASSRLESRRATRGPLRAGDTAFETSMEGATGTERVREVQPGLFEVAVEVLHPADGVRVALTTWILREGRR